MEVNSDRMVRWYSSALDKWVNDPMLASVFNAATATGESEVNTDFLVAMHLVSCGRIRLEQFEEELARELAEVRKNSAKSLAISNEHIYQADLCWINCNYAKAIFHYDRHCATCHWSMSRIMIG